ncbi:uncharacterized protein LOC133302989 [Gastrolobium bilobum]|uniref:uncharacterized protein LOC133302989 n=1 Tax=Gastrolobium bilobum TaxID=150636 RepID=UPI002AB25553|nr:uncharacterized protein LOC133302989 [Gastrolobium bilobum]
MVKVGAKNGEHADHQLEASHVLSVTANHINAKGMLTLESSTKSSYDVNEPENIPVSHLIENSLIQDGVPGDKAVPTLPTTESVGVETVDKGIQEKIYMEAESTVTDTTDVQRRENDFEEKKKAPEAFDQHEVSHQSSMENEQKVELLAKGKNLEICVIKHPNLEGKTADINPISDTEKHEKDPGSYTGEKLEIKDGGKFINEEAKEMEEAADMQLLKTTTESVLEDEVQSTLPTSTIVKGEKIEEIFQEQTLEEEESAAVDNNDSCRPENELDHLANVFEATDQPKSVAKDGAENVDHHYEQSTMENMTTKHISSEGMVTTENSTKSSYDVEELEKVPDLGSVGNAEIKDAGKITLEEAIDIKEATDVELQKPEIESVPEEKSISTLSRVSSVRVEESIREELQNEVEPAVTDVKEGQRIENDFEENMKVLEAFGPQKATGNTYAENEKKAEPQSEAQRMETTVIKHPYLKGLETAEKSPSIYIDELEKVPTSHTGEKLDIKDGGKIIQEEAKEREEATEIKIEAIIQSLKTATQCVHKDETPSTLAIVEGETVEQSFQDQTPKEEESTTKDNKNNSRPENKLEQTTKVLEPISQPETTNMVSAENEENADYQSEAPSMENVITKQNAGKIMLEEAIDIKEATDVELQKSETDSVPEHKSLSTLPTTASVTVEAIEKSTQEEIHKKEESAVTDTEEGQRPEYDFEKNKVPQTFHIHKGRGNTCLENEKKAEPQSEAQTIETMVIKYSNLEGQVATEINPDIDTEVLEKVPVSQEGEKLEIKDGRKIIKEEEKEMEEATSMQSPKTAIQSLPEDESSSTLPTWTFVKGETFEKNFSEQTLKEAESTEIENKSCRTENQLEQTTKVLEASDLAKLMGKVSAENEEHTDQQSEVPSTENMITEYTNSEGMLTTESSRKSSCVEELENIPESHSFENSEIKDSGKIMTEEEIYIQEATDAKLQKSETESVPEDKALSTLPTKASGEAETVEKSIQQEIRKETESAETDTKEGQIAENDFKENMEVLKV